MYQRTNIRRGMAVLSSDGVQMGRVVDVMAGAIIVEKGQFFRRDFRIPIDDISTVQGDELILMRDRAALKQADSEVHEGSEKATVGIAGIAAPPSHGGPGLRPTELTEARMESGRGHVPDVPFVPPPHEPPMAERRAAGPGWDPLSVDEEQEEAPRTSGPDPVGPTRY